MVQLRSIKAVQVVGDKTFPLAEGTLNLEPIETDTLLLRIGDSFAVTLKPDTIAGTTDNGAHLLVIKSQPADLTIRLEHAKDTTEAELEAVERVLVEAGFMLTGPQADADALAREIGRIAGKAADQITGFARTGLERFRGVHNTNTETETATAVEADAKEANGAGSVGTRFSETTHYVSERSAEGAKVLGAQAQKVSSWLGQSVQSFGTLLGDTLGTRGAVEAAERAPAGSVKREAVDTAKDLAESGKILGEGVSHGAQKVGDAAGKAIDTQARERHGEEGVKLAQEARTTATGAGQVASSAMLGTSGTVHAGHLAEGAVSSSHSKDGEKQESK